MCFSEKCVVRDFFAIFFLSIILHVAAISAMTVSEFRQIVTDSKIDFKSARLIYSEKFDSNEQIHVDIKLSEMHPNYPAKAIDKADQHTHRKMDITIDRESKSTKYVIEELRDVGAILKAYNLPQKQKINISKTGIKVRSASHQMSFKDASMTVNNTPILNVYKRPATSAFEDRMVSLGVVNVKLLDDDLNPLLNEVEINGNSILRIQFIDPGNNVRGTILCDPELGYRFKSIRWQNDERVIREIIADDYRQVDGVPYPFSYVDRRFDEKGKVLREKSYIFEEVKLGVEVSEEDFKIDLPNGTVVTDLVITGREFKIDNGGKFDIGYFLNLGALEIAQDMLSESVIVPEVLSTTEEIFIPTVDKARKEGKSFVLDVAKEALFDLPVNSDIDTEQVNGYLIKKNMGDIAWNGSLIALRKASLFNTKQNSKQPLQCTKGKWVGLYELPEEVELPYNFIIATKEGLASLVTIKEIKPDGIKVVCEKLNADEVKLYRVIEK